MEGYNRQGGREVQGYYTHAHMHTHTHTHIYCTHTCTHTLYTHIPIMKMVKTVETTIREWMGYGQYMM